MIKHLMIYFLLCNLIIAETTIKIYNNGYALVQQEQKKKFSSIGKQTIKISNLPISAIPSSINILSDDISPILKQYFYEPISTKKLLDANIGNEIELVAYGESGNITFSTIGKLISNNISPIFEIDNKIVIDHPYKYRFKNIPSYILDYPHIDFTFENFNKNIKYDLSYIINNIHWDSEFNLFINKESEVEVEGWYCIQNDNKIVYKNADVLLISGIINFDQKDNRVYSNRRLPKMGATFSSSSKNILVDSKTEEYKIYSIPEKIDLDSNSEIRYNFISKKNVSYNTVYYIKHSIFRSRSTDDKIDVPVNVRYDLIANQIADFQLPKATYNLYEKQDNEIIFVGSSKFDIVSEEDKIKLTSGKTNDVLCNFTIEEANLGKKKIILNASFKNRKNKTVSIEWVQETPESRMDEVAWEIIDSNLSFTKLDYNSSLFQFKIPANSHKQARVTISAAR